MQNIEIFDKRCEECVSHVFSPEVSEVDTFAWPEAEKISTFRSRLMVHRRHVFTHNWLFYSDVMKPSRACNEMQEEVCVCAFSL